MQLAILFAISLSFLFRFLHLIIQIDIVLSLLLGIFHGLPCATAAPLDAKDNQI